MICPVPAGVHPNTHVCGECGGRLTMPWRQELDDNALLCPANEAHDTYQKKKYGQTNRLYDEGGNQVEVDIMTQQPTNELAPITDQATALATVNRALDLGLFPEKATPGQAALLAQVALAYRLDPLMGEIMPYQGKPYITIKGRRRLDAFAHNRPGIRFRSPDKGELDYYLSVSAINPGDVIQICIGTDPATGTTTEGFGRVLHSEFANLSAGARNNLPVAMRKIEMAQKRAEMRMRDMMYGPVPRPAGLDDVEILHEGDVVEGEVTRISPPIETSNSAAYIAETEIDIPDQGDLGTCPIHDGAEWFLKLGNWGGVQASHKPASGPWCEFKNVYGYLFQEAFKAVKGEQKKSVSDAWLKEYYGDTWSKLEPWQMKDAVESLKTPPEQPDEPQGSTSDCPHQWADGACYMCGVIREEETETAETHP